MGIDTRLLNGKPRCTAIESFSGEVTVIGPRESGWKREHHKRVEDAIHAIDEKGWVVGISHLHGPYGQLSKEESNNGSHSERNARPSGEKNQAASL